MTKASRDTQGGRKVKRGEGKKERRERERKGEERKGKRQVFPATNKRPGRHQRKRGVILSIPFRKTPGSKERKGGEGRGRRGAKFSTGSNEPHKQTLAATVTYAVPKLGWLLRPLRSRKGISQLGIPNLRLHLRVWEITTNPRSTGPRRHSTGSSRALTRRDTHLWICVLTGQRCHTPA